MNFLPTRLIVDKQMFEDTILQKNDFVSVYNSKNCGQLPG